MGDPSGIGPEIILRSFMNRSIGKARLIVIGDYSVMLAAYKMLNINSFVLKKVVAAKECVFSDEILNILDLQLINIGELQYGKVQSVAGNAAFECIRKAVDLARIGKLTP